MFNLTLSKIWVAIIKGWSTTDPVLGGPPSLDSNGDPLSLPTGVDNVPILQLADRTEFLKWRHSASNPNRRNAIETGKVDMDGIPAYAQVVASPVSAEIVADANNPLVLTFAGGWDDHGPIDFYKRITANTPVTAELGSGPEYLFAVYNDTTDTVSFISRQISSAYVVSPETPSPSGTSFWYNPYTATMYESTGSAFVKVYAVFMGTLDYAFITVNLEDAGKDISGHLMPVGSVQAFAGEVSKVPQGWLVCQGQAISRADYRRLFILFGTLYGPGDGSTTFNIPDLRGYFIRGFSDGGPIDTSRVLGSTQTDLVGPHDHNADSASADFVVADPTFNVWDISAGTGGKSDTNTADSGVGIGTETRPKNVAMNYMIKY